MDANANPATHYWVRIKKPDGYRYFVRFVSHHPGISWTMNRQLSLAYCFASLDDARRVRDVLRADTYIDVEVVSTRVQPPPPPPPPRQIISFGPPPRLKPWADKILHTGQAAGREGRDRVDVGYRLLARQHHPDRGGKVTDMQLLNDARRWLVEHYEDAEEVPF
jgi:hypothetical protein